MKQKKEYNREIKGICNKKYITDSCTYYIIGGICTFEKYCEFKSLRNVKNYKKT